MLKSTNPTLTTMQEGSSGQERETHMPFQSGTWQGSVMQEGTDCKQQTQGSFSYDFVLDSSRGMPKFVLAMPMNNVYYHTL